MKKVVGLLIVLHVSLSLKAQPDVLNYEIILKDSSFFNCKLISQIPHKILHIQKEDSSEIYIHWKNISAINVQNAEGEKVNINTLSKSDLNALRAYQNRQWAHEKWVHCFIIKLAGDTIYGKVKSQRNYSSTSAIPWKNTDIFFADAQDKEEVFTFSDIKELSIGDNASGYRKYLAIDGGMGYTDLYKVVTDGNCKVVYKEVENMYVTKGWEGGAANTGNYYNNEFYYVFYKNELTRMRNILSGDMFGSLDVAIGFKSKCRDVFSECPTLVAKIENGSLKGWNVRQLVNEFNQCIAKK